MRERERDRIRLYEPEIYRQSDKERERQKNGRVVVKGSELPWDMHRQANSRRYLSRLEPELRDTVLQDWEVFEQWIPERSGKHTHQGGLGIFILEGEGYTVIDGVRHNWKEGDLVVLPIKNGGCEHQHFNSNPDTPVKWLAVIYWPFLIHLGYEVVQKESSPWYEAYVKDIKEAGGTPDAK